MANARAQSMRLACAESFLGYALELGINIEKARDVIEVYLLVREVERNASRKDILEPGTDRRDSDPQ